MTEEIWVTISKNDSIESGDIVETTTSEFPYDGINCQYMRKDEVKSAKVRAKLVSEDYSDYEPSKCRNGGKYGYQRWEIEEVLYYDK